MAASNAVSVNVSHLACADLERPFCMEYPPAPENISKARKIFSIGREHAGFPLIFPVNRQNHRGRRTAGLRPRAPRTAGPVSQPLKKSDPAFFNFTEYLPNLCFPFWKNSDIIFLLRLPPLGAFY
jgi:hypothetical protein